MEVARSIARRKEQLYGWGVISTTLIEFFQTFKPVTCARMLIAQPRQLSFSIADGFMSLNNRIDRRFALRLESRNMVTSRTKLLRKLLRLDFSFCMLNCRAFSFACQALG